MVKFLCRLLLWYIPTVYNLLKANMITTIQKTNNRDNNRLYALISQSGSMMSVSYTHLTLPTILLV